MRPNEPLIFTNVLTYILVGGEEKGEHHGKGISCKGQHVQAISFCSGQEASPAPLCNLVDKQSQNIVR